MLRGEFDVSLKQLLCFCGYHSSSFKGHCFRIGAATAVGLRGVGVGGQMHKSGQQAGGVHMLLESI